MIPPNQPARLIQDSNSSQIVDELAKYACLCPSGDAVGEYSRLSGRCPLSGAIAGKVAECLRHELRSYFGGVAFQVTPETDYGTSIIEVAWADGPPLYAADVVVRQTMRRLREEIGHGQELSSCRISKRRTMSPDAEEKILGLLGSALGIEEFDMDAIHPTPPLLARPEGRFTEGTIPEFLDLLFEKLSFCRECPAPASGGDLPCPCIIVCPDR